MKLMGNCGDSRFGDDGGGAEEEEEEKIITSDDGGGGALVLVGVKLDISRRNNDLLTCALVKLAKPGDRVIALHVIIDQDTPAATLLAVKEFDNSLVSAYDGLCKLKQIDLRLKVCRGASVRKVLAREATSYGAISLIVGTSLTQSALRSPVSVANYCARHVRRGIMVFAVDNGKIVFRREGIICVGDVQCFVGGSESRIKMSKKKTLSQSSLWRTSEELSSRFSSSSEHDLNNTMALVVHVKREGVLQKKSGWGFLQKLLLDKGTSCSQSSCKKNSLRQWLLRQRSRTSLSTICPDHQQGVPDKVDVDYHYTLSSVAEYLSDYKVGIPTNELESLFEKESSKCRLFSYRELLSATSNFNAEKVIGKGGNSEVYGGILEDGKEVAVKILKPSGDGSKQFVSEIEILTSLAHDNIVTLIGFCFEENHLLLVYDLLHRGSLEDNLHGNRRARNLFGWEERHKVALGVAEALEHLHIAVTEPIIHRDVKSSNILLSDDFEPKLSDFGLATLACASSYDIDNADVAGTFGYLAPEYVMHGKVLDKIDVYAYGVVLLELLSGRKPIDNGSTHGLENLVNWAKRILKGNNLADLLDPTLADSQYQDLLEQMVLAASLCIRHEPSLRPHMSLVVKLLQGEPGSVKWAREQVNTCDKLDALEGEIYATNIQSFINLAFLDLEDDDVVVVSGSSGEQTVSVNDYLNGRCSRSSSFNHSQKFLRHIQL